MKKILSLVLALAMCLGMASFAVGAADTLVDSGINYHDSTESLTANPERGQVGNGGWTVCSKSGTTKVLNPTGAYNTVMYDLRCFSAGNTYTNGGKGKTGVGGKDIPINEQTLDAIRQTLENARKNGAAMAFRFAYAYDESYGNEPSDINMMLYHIKQLSDVINDFSDIVVSLECGMIGPWGEMHSSMYDSTEYGPRIVGKWLECLDESIALQVRSPQDIIRYYGLNSASLMALSPMEGKKNFYRLGMYNDGYLGTSGDYGTYHASNTNLGRADAVKYLSYLDYVPYGGELAYVDEEYARKNSIIYDKNYNLVEEFYYTHLSYLRNIGDLNHSLTKCISELKFDKHYDFEGMPDVSEYYGLDLQKFMFDHMGYRFVLRESKLSSGVVPGGELRLTGKIENTGFGNVLKDKEAEILLYKNGAYYSCPIDLNAKYDIKSRSIYDYDFTLVLPKNIAADTYEVFLRLSKPNEDITGDSLYNIALANEGVYNRMLGANKIGTVTVSGEPTGDNEYLYEKEYKVNGTSVPTVIDGYTAKAQADIGQNVTLGYFVENATDITYYVGNKKLDTKNGRAEFKMSGDTIGACTVAYKAADGSAKTKQFMTLTVSGHNYVETSRVESTCTETGKIVYTCSDCGDVIESTIAVKAHEYEPVINNKKCASVCKNCGDSTVIKDYDSGMAGNTVYGLEPQSASGDAVVVVGTDIPEYTFENPSSSAYFALAVDGLGENSAVLGGLRTVTKSSEASGTKDSNSSGNMNYFKGFSLNGDGGYIFGFGFNLVNWDSPYRFGTLQSIRVNDKSVTMGVKSEGLDNASFTPIGVYETKPFYDVYFCDEEGNILSKASGTYSLNTSDIATSCVKMANLEDLYTGDTPTKTVNGKPATFEGWKTVNGDKVKYALGTMVLVPDFGIDIEECEHKNVTVTDVEATCVKEGYHSEVCNDCGKVIKEETIKAAGHKLSTKTVVEPTYASTGEKVRYCMRCGEHIETEKLNVIASPFKDVNSTHWFADSVYYAFSNKLFLGTSKTEFSPNAKMTRGMLVTVLYRLDHDGADADNSVSKTFKDVKEGSYYTGAVEWAAANEIVNGITPTTFAPNSNVTREQTAAILYRYANYKGYDTKPKADISVFKDRDDLSSWAEDAIKWANAYSIVSGISPIKLDPKGNATRAQVAKMFWMVDEMVVNDFTVK